MYFEFLRFVVVYLCGCVLVGWSICVFAYLCMCVSVSLRCCVLCIGVLAFL